VSKKNTLRNPQGVENNCVERSGLRSTHRKVSAVLSFAVPLPVSFLLEFAASLTDVAAAPQVWPQEPVSLQAQELRAWLPPAESRAVAGALSAEEFASAELLQDAPSRAELVPEDYSVAPPAADSRQDDLPPADSWPVASAEAGSVEDDSAALQECGSSPVDGSVEPPQVDSQPGAGDSVEPEPPQPGARSQQEHSPVGSSVDLAALPAGLTVPRSAGSPEVLPSPSPVCPEAPASPSAALPRRWLDAASANRFSPTVVRGAPPELAAVLQMAPAVEGAFSWLRLVVLPPLPEARPHGPPFPLSNRERSRASEPWQPVRSAARTRSAERSP
jgi:hypothetical protein